MLNSCIIYCRVSSKEQEDTGYSLEAQEQLLLEYASKKNLNVKRIIKVSESASGKTTRKVFNEMIKDLDDQGINIILCEKIDRLTRNPKDSSTIAEWVKVSEDREVHFAKENFILNKHTKAHENLMWEIKVAVAGFYTNNLSEEVKKGQMAKIKDGWLPTKPPIGYKTIGDSGHKIHVIDEDTAPLIRQMFELYSTGNYSTAKLGLEIFNRGLKQKSGKMIPKSRVHTLLTSKFYIGLIEWKGEEYDGKHDPIIGLELFNKVQSILKRKTFVPRYAKHNQLLKGMCFCDGCGGLLSWELQKGRYYGHCSSSRECAKRTYIREDKAEDQILKFLESIRPANDEILKWIEDCIRENNYEQIEAREKEIFRINRRLSDLRIKKDNVYEAKINKEVPLDFCQRKIGEYEMEEKSLIGALKRAESECKSDQEIGIMIHEISYRAPEIYKSLGDNNDEKRLIIRSLISNFTQNRYELRPNLTETGEYLSKWMPILNREFELAKTVGNKRQKDPIESSCSGLLPG